MGVIFASTTKVDGTLGTYVDRSQTTPKCKYFASSGY